MASWSGRVCVDRSNLSSSNRAQYDADASYCSVKIQCLEGLDH